MKYVLVFFTLLSLGLHAQTPPKTFQLPPYEKVVLPNGLTLYLLEQHEVPLLYVSGIFPAGAIHDQTNYGLANLTADALLFGTQSYTKAQIEETLDFLGANLSTGATKEAATLFASFATKDQDRVFPILKEILTSPVFEPKEFDKRKTRLLTELRQAKESPRSVVGDYFAKFVFGDHVYANPVNGTPEGVQGITAAEAKAFYASHYVPNGSALAIAGDFDTKAMKAKLTALFRDWKKGTVPNAALAAKPIETPKKPRILLVDRDNAIETTFLIGQMGITRNNPDYVAVDVVNTVLGGRFTSWLNDELRVNSGLTYGANSRFSPLKNSGTFVVSTFTKTATTTDAIDLALKVIDRLHTQGIDEATLASAKNYVKGQFPPRYETAGSLANFLTQMHFYGLNEGYINDFSRKVDALTPATVQAVIQKYFPKEAFQFVLIGRAADLREKVKKYGEVSEKGIKAPGF